MLRTSTTLVIILLQLLPGNATQSKFIEQQRVTSTLYSLHKNEIFHYKNLRFPKGFSSLKISQRATPQTKQSHYLSCDRQKNSKSLPTVCPLSSWQAVIRSTHCRIMQPCRNNFQLSEESGFNNKSLREGVLNEILKILTIRGESKISVFSTTPPQVNKNSIPALSI